MKSGKQCFLKELEKNIRDRKRLSCDIQTKSLEIRMAVAGCPFGYRLYGIPS